MSMKCTYLLAKVETDLLFDIIGNVEFVSIENLMNHEWKTELLGEILAEIENVKLDRVEVLDGLIKEIWSKFGPIHVSCQVDELCIQVIFFFAELVVLTTFG